MNTLITFIGENAAAIVLWAIVLFAGAVVLSVPILAVKAWRQSRREDREREATIRMAQFARSLPSHPYPPPKAPKGWENRHKRADFIKGRG